MQAVRAGLVPEPELHLDGHQLIRGHGRLRERPGGQDHMTSFQTHHLRAARMARNRERRQHEAARPTPTAVRSPTGRGPYQAPAPGHRTVTTSDGHRNGW